MEKFVIEGGYPLSGTVVPAGNKNAALPALAACLLTEEEVVLRNIPRISDVEAMLELLRRLGTDVEWRDDNVVALQAGQVSEFEVDFLTDGGQTAETVATALVAFIASATRTLDVAIYDFHATVLHLLGLNHERLTYYHNGIQRRLTDVHGHVITPVLA